MRKSQVDIVSAILILMIALSLTGTAYVWGYPLIQKRQASATVDRVYSYFNQENSNSLSTVIEYVANNKGEKTFFLDVGGMWQLNETENSLQFTFQSKVSNFALNTIYPISLTASASCIPEPSPKNGTVGLDKPSVVCVRANRAGDMVTINYKIWFRELHTDPFSPTTRGFKIELTKDPSGLLISTSKTVKIIFSDTSQQQIDSKTLIITKIKILLI